MNNLQSLKEQYINIANNKISSAAGDFINYLEDIKKISDVEGQSIIEQNLNKIDQAYENILAVYRPNIRRFVENHIRTILAADKISSVKD